MGINQTPYQNRMSRFVSVGSLYAAATPVVLWLTESPNVGWVVYASTLVILHCLATGFDAVYDSLSQRLPSGAHLDD